MLSWFRYVLFRIRHPLYKSPLILDELWRWQEVRDPEGKAMKAMQRLHEQFPPKHKELE